MNKVVDNLLKNVEEFEIFFNEYEKQFYPEIRKARKMLLLFLCLLIVFMFGDLILLRFFSDSPYWKVSLIITLIILFFSVFMLENLTKSQWEHLVNSLNYAMK